MARTTLTPAERQARHRARTKPVTMTLKQAETVDRIAEYFETSRAEVVHSMIQFALMNRNWKQLGLFGTRTWNTPGTKDKPNQYVRSGTTLSEDENDVDEEAA